MYICLLFHHDHMQIFKIHASSSLDQDLMYLVMLSRNRTVSIPTHLELFQIGGDLARLDWQTAH